MLPERQLVWAVGFGTGNQGHRCQGGRGRPSPWRLLVGPTSVKWPHSATGGGQMADLQLALEPAVGTVTTVIARLPLCSPVTLR